MGVKYFYRDHTVPEDNRDILSDLLSSLASGIVSVAGSSKGSFTELSGPAGPLAAAFNSFRSDNNADPSGKPKAFLNWILLDEQFQYVSGSSGAIAVNQSDVIDPLLIGSISMKKNGYLYIYVSNETENWDVFFDNLVVQHRSGPILEETHYYPFGLTMAGISSKALKSNYAGNSNLYNGKELQNIEFSDGAGLEMYDFGARNYDPQIGRWHSVDPLSELNRRWSPYVYAANNSIRYIDPDGMKWKDPENDAEVAERLQKNIKIRKEDETKNLNAANRRVERIKSLIAKKSSSEKLEKRLQDANAEVANITETINELDASSYVLTQMGSNDIAQEFTFKEISGVAGKTYKEGGVITMEIVGDANAVHESTHGWQIHTGSIISEGKDKNTMPSDLSTEISAYRRQHAFDPRSTNNLSYLGNVNILNNITRAWVIGVNYNRVYPYGELILGPGFDPRVLEKWLKTQKK